MLVDYDDRKGNSPDDQQLKQTNNNCMYVILP